LEISEFEKKVIEVLHEQSGYQTGAAIILGYSASGLNKRLCAIKKRTGLDPRKLDDRLVLLSEATVGMGHNLTPREKQIILATCKYNMNFAEVGRQLYFHQNLMGYYRDSIERKTGLSIRKFDDLIKLRELVLSDLK